MFWRRPARYAGLNRAAITPMVTRSSLARKVAAEDIATRKT